MGREELEALSQEELINLMLQQFDQQAKLMAAFQ
jgi:hypothetical protein